MVTRQGSITSGWEQFHEWKRLAEEQPGAVDMETLLKGVCEKRNFMDLVENFILFDDSPGETKKILARNHQFMGVNRAIEAVRETKRRLDIKGQGGKSLRLYYGGAYGLWPENPDR
jgi:type I restriction enzyme R subunit